MKKTVIHAITALEDVIRFFKKKKDILFLVYNEIMLSYALPVYDLMAKDRRIRSWFCFVGEDGRFDPDNIKEIQQKFKGRIIPYKSAKLKRWDLILYPSHGPYFRSRCPKIYIGHSLKSGKIAKEGPY